MCFLRCYRQLWWFYSHAIMALTGLMTWAFWTHYSREKIFFFCFFLQCFHSTINLSLFAISVVFSVDFQCHHFKVGVNSVSNHVAKLVNVKFKVHWYETLLTPPLVYSLIKWLVVAQFCVKYIITFFSPIFHLQCLNPADISDIHKVSVHHISDTNHILP